MIHGWGVNFYNSNINCEKVEKDIAWKDRRELVNLLKEKYSLLNFNLPGFCCTEEPNKHYFDIEDFSNYLAKWLKDKKTKPSAIVAYSFGGAIALDYKARYKSDIPVILISPALKRKETIKSQFGSMGKGFIPQIFFDSLKSFYQSLFSRYYREGTPFLRASYDKIARRDTRPLLDKVDLKEILLIFGEQDTSTPVEYILEATEKNHPNCIIIKGGGHNIGGTHPKQVSSAIIEFLSTRTTSK